MADCLFTFRKTVDACTEFRDKGHEECAGYRQESRDECRKWDQKCCDWWPCSWGCKLLTWICVALVTIIDWICVGFFWVANVVCVAWGVVTLTICVVIDAATTALGALWETLESIIGWLYSAAGWALDVLLSIPYIGPALREALRLLAALFFLPISIAGAAAYTIGIRPEKKLRICPVLLCRESNASDLSKQSIIDDFVRQINSAIKIYRDEANVRVLLSAPFQYSSGFAGQNHADESWIRYFCPDNGPDDSVIDPKCGKATLVGETFSDGTEKRHAIARDTCFYGNWRRILGYGAPLVVFHVRRILTAQGNLVTDDGAVAGGCAPGTTDHVFTTSGAPDRTLAHEFGHKCLLEHTEAGDNLMTPSYGNDPGANLDLWQVLLIRNSRYVTYF